MGFIDYHGTKEDRYTDVLEYSRTQQEEDWKYKEEQKISLWLRKLTGNGSYAKMNVAELVKYIVVKYRYEQKIWNKLEPHLKKDLKIETKQLWEDFCIDLAARHLSLFPINGEKRIRYLQSFQTKFFRLDTALAAEDHYRYISENPKYRKYYAECFDPTWKGQHFFKWLWDSTKKDEDGLKGLEEFIEIDKELSLLLGIYLHQVLRPHDEGWMREIEAEQQALSEIRGKIKKGVFYPPERTLLKNPIVQGEDNIISSETGNKALEDKIPEEIIRDEPGSDIPESELNKKEFQELIQKGRIIDYIAASKLLLGCSLPENIAQIYSQLVERMPILQDAVDRYDHIYHADLNQLEEYFIPEALKVTAVYLDYQVVRPSEKILKVTRDNVFLATRKLLQVVNEKIDEIYRFVTIDANAEAKALETLMSQDGHVDLAYKIK